MLVVYLEYHIIEWKRTRGVYRWPYLCFYVCLSADIPVAATLRSSAPWRQSGINAGHDRERVFLFRNTSFTAVKLVKGMRNHTCFYTTVLLLCDAVGYRYAHLLYKLKCCNTTSRRSPCVVQQILQEHITDPNKTTRTHPVVDPRSPHLNTHSCYCCRTVEVQPSSHTYKYIRSIMQRYNHNLIYCC